MVGGIFLESALSEKSQVADCACPDEIQVTTQQEATMFGWGKCKNGVRKKKFFFITVDSEGCCGTYQ